MTERVCVVAGVGPGMGRAIAGRFAEEGYSVALLARNGAQIGGFASALKERHVIEARAYSVDLAQPKTLAPVFESIRNTLGDPEVLVYNAARWLAMPAMEMTPDGFAQDLSLSVVGALACAQQVAPAMHGGHGSLLFTGGGLALYPHYGKSVASLTAAKSALRGLVYALAGELAPAGVHVATVTSPALSHLVLRLTLPRLPTLSGRCTRSRHRHGKQSGCSMVNRDESRCALRLARSAIS